MCNRAWKLYILRYPVLNMEDNRGKAVNKFVRTEEMINDVKRFIEEDRCVDVARGHPQQVPEQVPAQEA